MECEIPCVKTAPAPYSYVDVGLDSGWYRKCPQFKKYIRTMEIAGIGSETHRSDDYILGTVLLDSDVPVQYFSWAEYDFMDPPAPKVSGMIGYIIFRTLLQCSWQLSVIVDLNIGTNGYLCNL